MVHRNQILIALVVAVSVAGAIAVWSSHADARWAITAALVNEALLGLFYWPPRVRR